MLSSMRMVLNLILASLESPAQIQVQQITSAVSSNSFSHCLRSKQYLDRLYHSYSLF